MASLQPACLFLDFDRTLCTTRGGSPLSGNHSVDEELVGLCSQMEGRVHICTRNANVEDIRNFLARRGLASVPVHRVARPRSKAEVVCDLRWVESPVAGSLGDGGNGGSPCGATEGPTVRDGATLQAAHSSGRDIIFVDDTIAELLDDQICAAPNVVRFLFARSG